jgi:hypothetical protein
MVFNRRRRERTLPILELHLGGDEDFSPAPPVLAGAALQ